MILMRKTIPSASTILVSSRSLGQEVLFKIDYYDNNLRFHSPDPADPAVTRRIMTIFLPEEY